MTGKTSTTPITPPMQQSPGDGAELGKEHEPCFVEEVDGTTVLTPLSLELEIGIPLKPFDGAEE